jgi:hypothetical protein
MARSGSCGEGGSGKVRVASPINFTNATTQVECHLRACGLSRCPTAAHVPRGRYHPELGRFPAILLQVT